MSERPRKRQPFSDAFMKRYGAPPWLIVAVLIFVVVLGALMYFLERGRGVRIPAPANLSLPTGPSGV